ncbi:MAG: ferrous iron transport protein A [Candidatus Faecivicinus sp.]
MKTIRDLLPGQHGVIRRMLNTGSMRRRLLDIGMIEGTKIECVGRSPAGDPMAYLIRGAVIAIRGEDGSGVVID